MKSKIKALAESIYLEVVDHRRYLHANPELSFQEFNTARYIKEQLTALGIPWEAMANTGVLGIIEGEKPSVAVIALRADMDALPLQETNDLPFKSTKAGVMHACGHDVHTSSLLGTARILQQLRAEFGGAVKLIFQPAEEKLPGGAHQMIKEGALENPKPRAVLGQHVAPALEAGKVAVRSGKFMASNDELYITIKGKGGHGAQPQQNVDPVVIASHIVLALQQIVSRMANPQMPTVLSIGKIVANGLTNIIPDEVYMEGTFRTMDEAWRTEGLARMKKMAEGVAESMGASCDFRILDGYPFLVNEAKLTERFREIAEDYLGRENVLETDIWMAAEDFAYYSHAVDACFYLLGVGNEREGVTSSVHTPTFQVDETALLTSSGLMAYAALKVLGN